MSKPISSGDFNQIIAMISNDDPTTHPLGWNQIPQNPTVKPTNTIESFMRELSCAAMGYGNGRQTRNEILRCGVLRTMQRVASGGERDVPWCFGVSMLAQGNWRLGFWAGGLHALFIQNPQRFIHP